MTSTVTIKPPLDETIKKLIEQLSDPKRRNKILIRAAAELKDRAAVYPEQGVYNFPRKGKAWYLRSRGSRWYRKDGSIGGRDTSQQLQNNWKLEVKDEFTASVYTDVTYAPYLLDAAQRINWAESHGWKTTDKIAEDYAPRFEEIILEELDKDIKE